MSEEEEIILAELDDEELVQQMFDDLYDGLREEIEEAFDMHAVDIYGLSEVMGPGVANECVESKDVQNKPSWGFNPVDGGFRFSPIFDRIMANFTVLSY